VGHFLVHSDESTALSAWCFLLPVGTSEDAQPQSLTILHQVFTTHP